MTATNRPQISTTEDTLSRLPYQLTTGVIATWEGLVMHDSPSPMYDIMRAMILPEPLVREHESGDNVYTWPWSDVAYRLRYREGEPWCRTEHGIVECWDGKNNLDDTLILHRLAAILCDDAAAFRVLYWCIHNLEVSDD